MLHLFEVGHTRGPGFYSWVGIKVDLAVGLPNCRGKIEVRNCGFDSLMGESNYARQWDCTKQIWREAGLFRGDTGAHVQHFLEVSYTRGPGFDSWVRIRLIP